MSSRPDFIVALAGRRIDQPDARTVRFPAESEGKVRARLLDLFRKLGATALVCSGASGTDLLAMEIAGTANPEGRRTIARKLILPFDPERFLVTSVADGWQARFWAVVDDVRKGLDGDELIVLGLGGQDREAYAETNRAILTRAQELASKAPTEPDKPPPGLLAVIVWDGESHGEADFSASFAREAHERRIRCHEVSTLGTTYAERLALGGQKKILTLEGGGILGLLSIAYLVRIEDELRTQLGRGEDFVLADYFDYVAGTSTGSIIATCVALGMSARAIRKFYVDHGAALCKKRWMIQWWLARYEYAELEAMLKKIIGESSTLGSPRLRTGLMVVLRNATTDSPWPLSNQPGARYNDPSRPDCNLDLALWQLVRGSTAAPTYYEPEEIELGMRKFVFVDGGVTVYNNPSFQLFAMATVDAYGLRWPAGEDEMLLVSIGTGSCPDANANLKPTDLNLRYNATRIPSALIAAASAQQDFLCRMYGRCVHGAPIDLEVGHMIHPGGVGPLGPGAKKQFRYVRYNANLTQKGLTALGLGTISSEDVIKIDSVAHIDDLVKIGDAAATADVDITHFAGFP